MQTRITLRDIAEICGCTIATVSRALRNRSEVAPATREQIKKVARDLGYAPDPALSALVQHRKGLRSARYLETLGLISPDLSWKETEGLPRRIELIESLKTRAYELGYKIEFVHLPAGESDYKGTVRTLHHKRIRGLIVLPSEPPAEEINFPWEEFAVVRLNRPPVNLRLSTVCTDLYQGIHLVLAHIVASRYRRPGLVMSELVDRYSGDTWPRYLAMIKSERSDLNPVSTFVFSGDFSGGRERERFAGWIERENPDLLLSFEASLVRQKLVEIGYEGCERIGIIDLDVEEEGELAGLLQSRKAIGHATIDEIHSMLLTNSTGLPDYPLTIKIAFHWVDGPSFASRDEIVLNSNRP